jgi:hypothetical protein
VADGPDGTTERVRYVAGLDLGRPGEFTALAVLEKHYQVGKRWFESDARYAVRYLERFPPGTAYGKVIEAVSGVFAEPPMKGGTLVVDQTAVGRAVFELIRDAETGADVRAVTITAGHAAQSDERGGWLVPKKDLAGVLQVQLQERRLKVAPALDHAQTLVTELQHFQLKTVPLDPSALEWRERPHDDLVLAVGIAVWQAERQAAFYFEVISGPEEPLPRWWRP